MRGEIVFRRAEPGDLPEIYRLLAVESQASKCSGMFSKTKQDMIPAELEKILVYTYQKRIIGVICGKFIRGKEKIHWMVVNPMFPEGTVCYAMVLAILGVYSRKPIEDKEHKKIWKTILTLNDRNNAPKHIPWNEGASFGFSAE